MRFKKGDRVKPTRQLLSNLSCLSSFVDGIKDGGIIDAIYPNEALVNFYSGHTYIIYLESLELEITKNQQLLFGFMDEDYDK